MDNNNNVDKTINGLMPLLPKVTLEEILTFEPDKPETYTKSPTINHMLAAMFVVKPFTALHKSLGVDAKHLCATCEVITGMKFKKIKDEWLKHRIAQLKREHPLWTREQLAEEMGFKDYTAIWKAEHRDARKKKYRKDQMSMEEWERLHEDFLKMKYRNV